jgi:hypothetical protein
MFCEGGGGGRSEEVQCNLGPPKVKGGVCVCVCVRERERERERFLFGISVYISISIDQRHQGGFWNGAVYCILL